MKVNIGKLNERAAEKANPINRVNLAKIEQDKAKQRAVVRQEPIETAPNQSMTNFIDRDTFDATVRHNYAGRAEADRLDNNADSFLAKANNIETPKVESVDEDIAGFVKDYNSLAAQDKSALLRSWQDSGQITSEQAWRILKESRPKESEFVRAQEEHSPSELRQLALANQQQAEEVRENTILTSPDFAQYEAAGAQNSANKAAAAIAKVQGVQSGELKKTLYTPEELLYSFMDSEERGIYNYLLGKYGEAEAENYYKGLREKINQRYGEDVADRLKKESAPIEALGTIVLGAEAGIDNAAQGIKQLFSKDALPTSATQYASAKISENLADVGPKILGKSLGQIGYDALTTTTNMIPSMMVGIASPVLGAATIGASSAGNAYNAAVKEGYSADQARTYAAIIGAAEGGLQYLLGGLSAYGGVSSEKLLEMTKGINNAALRLITRGGIRIGSEIAEEELQMWLEPLLRSQILGDEFNAPKFEEMAYTAILTALTTGALEGSTALSRRGLNFTGTAAEQTSPTQETPAQDAPEPQEAPAQQERETQPTQQGQAQQTVYEMLAGTASNSKAETILENNELLQAFKEITGIEPTGTKAQQRAAVKAEFGKAANATEQIAQPVALGTAETAVASTTAQATLGALPEGTGAMSSAFTTEQKRSRAESHTLQAREKQSGVPEDVRSPIMYDTVSEKQSVTAAQQRIDIDMPGEIEYLRNAPAWTGEDNDAAHEISKKLKEQAGLSGDWSEYQEWRKTMVAHESESGRALQSQRKYTRDLDADAIVAAAADELNAAETVAPSITKEGTTDNNKVLDTVYALAVDYDAAKASGEANKLADVVRKTASVRKTTGLFSKTLSRTMEWALSRVIKSGDIQFLEDLAANGIIAIASDYQTTSVADTIKTIRRLAMLSKVTTIMRNLISNGVFDVLDSAASAPAALLDMLLSRFTKTRSTTFEKGWFSKNKRRGSMNALAKSFLEVGLDVNAQDSSSKYEDATNRTAKMSKGIASRVLSTFEKNSGYLLVSPDQFFKGGVEAEIQSLVDDLYARGLIKDDSLKDAGQIEALYRTFQDKTLLSSALSGVRQALNYAGTKGFKKLPMFKDVNWGDGNIGIGDILIPFVQIAANLGARAAEYSPIGFINMATEVTGALLAARKGQFTAAQQRQIVKSFGRAFTGSALIALATAAALKGVLRVQNPGGEQEDKDKAALEKAMGLSGTQLNVSALYRGLTGQGWEWQDGDELMNIAFLDPLNSVMTTGALIAEDVEEDGFDALTVLGDSASGAIKAVLDLPVMEVARDAVNAYQYSDHKTFTGKMGDVAAEFAADTITSFIPNILRGVAQGTDSTQRDLFTGGNVWERLADNAVSAVPGARENLPAKVDNFGNEISYGDGLRNFLNNNILPGYLNEYKETLVTKELDRLSKELDSASFYPDRKAPNDFDVDGVKYELSTSEKDMFQRAYGSIAEELMSQFVEREDYAELSDTIKAEVLTEIKAYAKDRAKKELVESRGDAYSSDWDDEAELGDLPQYLAVKKVASAALKDKANRDFNAIDALLGTYNNLSDAEKEMINKSSTLGKLDEISAAAEKGFTSEEWYALADSIEGDLTQDKLRAALKVTGWRPDKREKAWNIYKDFHNWKKDY